MRKYGDLLTFLKDLDDLIKYHHGDVRKLREIRNTIRHDNFITTEDKNYVQSLVDEHLNGQPLEGSYTSKKADTRIKLQTRSKDRVSGQQTRSAFNFSSNKNRGILAGAAAAIAIIAIVGFTATNQGDMIDSSIISTPNNPLLITVDQTQYQRADIISISGDSTSDRQPIVLSIENTNGVKIWKESIAPKNDGNFSTLVIAGGSGWKDGGSYTLKAVQNDLIKEIKFRFVA